VELDRELKMEEIDIFLKENKVVNSAKSDGFH
jgi:hypothetical protein